MDEFQYQLLKIILIFVSQNMDFSQQKQYRNRHQLTGNSWLFFVLLLNQQQRKASCKSQSNSWCPVTCLL